MTWAWGCPGIVSPVTGIQVRFAGLVAFRGMTLMFGTTFANMCEYAVVQQNHPYAYSGECPPECAESFECEDAFAHRIDGQCVTGDDGEGGEGDDGVGGEGDDGVGGEGGEGGEGVGGEGGEGDGDAGGEGGDACEGGEGDGLACINIDECATGVHDCDVNATYRHRDFLALYV